MAIDATSVELIAPPALSTAARIRGCLTAGNALEANPGSLEAG